MYLVFYLNTSFSVFDPTLYRVNIVEREGAYLWVNVGHPVVTKGDFGS